MNRLFIPALALFGVIGGAVSHGQTMSLDLPDDSSAPQDTLVTTSAPPVTEAEMAGYYPTASDLFFLGDRDYPRLSYSQDGPDARGQLASDIFLYESGEQDFYARNREMFDPINRVLGVFTPQKAFTAEFSSLPLSGIALDGGFPIFTRTFEPRNAHVKLGPIAFDLVWLGAGALWSDFNGVNSFPAGQEDGWISFLEVAVRGNLQITDTIHLSWLANLVYLPGTNEIALSSLNNGFPNVALDLFFQRRVGTWDILLSDRFYARPGLDLFAELAVDGFDRSGRYQFGFYGREGRINTYDTQNVWLTNEISAKATTMIPEADWRFWLTLQHFDFWQSFDFDDHQTRDTLEALLGYEGNNIPFAPSLSYTVSSYDQFESFWHRVQVMFNGRLTENIEATAMGGYLWTSNLDPQQVNYLWSLGLTHQFSQKGSHSLNVGQNLFEDPFSPEVQFATYYRYNIDYQLAKRLTAGAYVQYSDGEFIVSTARRGTGDFETYLAGATLQFQPFDFTRITGLVAYEDGEFDNAVPYDRWIYRVMLTQQLASRLTLETLYQFEDFEGAAAFNEHLVSMSLRWYF